MNAETLIAHLNLAPHPEGGFYRRTYSSPGNIPQAALPCGFRGARAFSTAILFLLRKGDYSRLHRIRQDELWHFTWAGLCVWLCLRRRGRKPRRKKCCSGRILWPVNASSSQCPGVHGSGQRPAPAPPFPWWAALWPRALTSRIWSLGVVKNFLRRFQRPQTVSASSARRKTPSHDPDALPGSRSRL